MIGETNTEKEEGKAKKTENEQNKNKKISNLVT